MFEIRNENNLIVVEDIKSFFLIKKKINIHKNQFWTNSIYVYEKLLSYELDVKFIDRFFNSDIHNKIFQNSIKFALKISNIIDKKNISKKNYKIGECYERQLISFLSTFIAKAFLVQKIIEYSSNNFSNVIFVGNDKLSITEVDLKIGRTDNLFFFLAKHIFKENSKIICIDNKNNYSKKDFNKEFKWSPLTKFFSLVGNNFNSFTFKILKIFFRQIYIPFTNHRTLFIRTTNFTLEENFFSLLFHFKHLVFNKDENIFKVENNPLTKNNKKGKAYEPINEQSFLVELFLPILKDKKILANLSNFFFQKLNFSIKIIEQNIEEYENTFKRVYLNSSTNKYLYSNGFHSVTDNLFAKLCNKYKIKTITSEHGLASGMSKSRDTNDNFIGTKFSDIGIYYSNIIYNKMEQISPKQKRIFYGLPKLYFFSYLKSLLIKMILKQYFKKKLLYKKTLIFVCDIDVNNFLQGPYRSNNYQFYKKTLSILNFLKKNYKDHNIIIKFYPGDRFYETYYFKKYCNQKNIIRVKNIDLRYIRFMGDKFFTTSSDSALGWILSSNKCCYYRSMKWEGEGFLESLYKKNKKKGEPFSILKDIEVIEKSNINICDKLK